MKIIFIISEDWYFCSHRKPIAMSAIASGWDVHLGCRVASCRAELETVGIKLHHLPLLRGSINAFLDVCYLFRLIRLYCREKPDIVHHVAMKPCLYGSLAACFCRVPSVVNALAGMGYLFSLSNPLAGLVRRTVLLLFRLLFNRKNSVLILQNPDDIAIFHNQVGVRPEQIRLIPGSGVDLNEFAPWSGDRQNEKPTFVMVSRLLHDKGVMELIEAAGMLKERGAAYRILLVGDADSMNPNAVDEQTVKEAEAKGWIEWLGRRWDVNDIYCFADAAVLPSYREGMPKSLIEATACGLPVVTTDMPGCREMVYFGGRSTADHGTKNAGRSLRHNDIYPGSCGRDVGEPQHPEVVSAVGQGPQHLRIGDNGILIPEKDAVALADAIEWLAENPEARERMGRNSRELAVREFGIDKVVSRTMDIYQELTRKICQIEQ